MTSPFALAPAASRPPRAGLFRLVLTLLGAVSCRHTATGSEAPAGGTYDQVMAGVTTTLTTDSSHQARVIAESAFVNQAAREITFHNLGVTLFDRRGEQVGVVQARRGVYSLGRSVMDIRDKVLLVTVGGDSLTTAHLSFDQRALRLSSDSAFVYRTRAGVVRGNRFDSDLTLRGVSAAGRAEPPR